MLDIRVAIKVVGRLLGIGPLHDVHQKRLHQRTVLFGLVKIARDLGAVILRVLGGVGLGKRGQVIPVLDNQAVLKAKDT